MDKQKKDENQIAVSILDQITQTTTHQAAVALGRLGGLKGGPARKKSLSAKRRKEIAQEAAKSRWSTRKKTS